jgi:hypothetical protein
VLTEPRWTDTTVLSGDVAANPQIEMLAKIAATTGIEFAFDVVPVGQEPTLVGKSFKGAPAHVYAGSMLVAAR